MKIGNLVKYHEPRVPEYDCSIGIVISFYESYHECRESILVELTDGRQFIDHSECFEVLSEMRWSTSMSGDKTAGYCYRSSRYENRMAEGSMG